MTLHKLLLLSFSAPTLDMEPIPANKPVWDDSKAYSTMISAAPPYSSPSSTSSAAIFWQMQKTLMLRYSSWVLG